jgi:hypothetical protein
LRSQIKINHSTCPFDQFKNSPVGGGVFICPALYSAQKGNLAMKNKTTPWLLLFGRTFLFVVIQSLFALGFFLAGSPTAWTDSEAWWMMVAHITNFICLAVMIQMYRAEGKSYWDIFRIDLKNIKGDLLVLLGVVVVTGPVSYVPNILLASWLFGSPEASLSFLIRPLPLWGVYFSIILFVVHGLVELPLYFVCVMPRLFEVKAGEKSSWLALTISALMLGFQHAALPLSPNLNGVIWHGLMFIPFAFLAGIILRWRPRLLPYMVAVHALMDIFFAMMLLPLAY